MEFIPFSVVYICHIHNIITLIPRFEVEVGRTSILASPRLLIFTSSTKKSKRNRKTGKQEKSEHVHEK